MEVEALQSILDDKFIVLEDSARIARSVGEEGEGLQWYQIELRPFEDEEDEDEQPVEGAQRARSCMCIHEHVSTHASVYACLCTSSAHRKKGKHLRSREN